MPLGRRCLLALACLLLACAIWLGSLHWVFRAGAGEVYDPAGVSPMATALADYHLHLWSKPELRRRQLDRIRQANAEWDFMARSYFVWSLANLALREPGRQEQVLPVVDDIIADTLRLESEQGVHYFLMPYSRHRPFVLLPARSQFVDGEIALMIALRRLVRDDRPSYRDLLRGRIDLMVDRMRRSPVLSAESYPDECWTFCNTIGLAAIRVGDYLDGTDHGPFIRAWLDTARRRLIDPKTGLLVSSYGLDGQVKDGPEGSTIWMVAHCLQVLDPAWAADQYARARSELGRQILGFGYSREWPPSWPNRTDIDSGAIIPGLELSIGASGMAFIGATTFGDRDFLGSLSASLNLGGFPERRDGRLRYLASNQVGDAALLYATLQGPAWKRVLEGRK